jgi:hypothetical protein
MKVSLCLFSYEEFGRAPTSRGRAIRGSLRSYLRRRWRLGTPRFARRRYYPSRLDVNKT